jgi:hypothetical protein
VCPSAKFASYSPLKVMAVSNGLEMGYYLQLTLLNQSYTQTKWPCFHQAFCATGVTAVLLASTPSNLAAAIQYNTAISCPSIIIQLQGRVSTKRSTCGKPRGLLHDTCHSKPMRGTPKACHAICCNTSCLTPLQQPLHTLRTTPTAQCPSCRTGHRGPLH